jgi:flagellar biosynthesis/type III secretory pathway M-ring protein FliF/YscJ
MEQSILLLLLRVCAFVSCLFFSFVVLSREVFLSVREEEEEEEEERERERERDFSHRDLIKERESFIIKQIGEEDGDVRRGRRE